MNKKGVLILLLCALCACQTIAQDQKPNILLIQVDDMGFDDLSINGNTVSNTPTLDAFSKEAVRFSNFYVHSVCAPTRASLLSGRDFWRAGVSAMHAGKDHLNLDETTFADIFQANGYATGMWGKWHSGKTDGYLPWHRGFDEGYSAKLYQYFPSAGWYNEFPKLTTHEDKWSAEVLVDYTIDFMDRKKDEPFLAYLSFLSVHDFWAAPEEYLEKYRQEGRTERFATLLAMLEYMDVQIARLFQYMDNNDLMDNTVILFMSDNGPNLGDTGPKEWAIRNNHGFLGNKSKLWQNGIKSPLYVRWGDTYKPKDVDGLVTITDIFPTILEIAGLSIPADNKPLDGRSFKLYLERENATLSPREAVFAQWYPIWEKDQWQPLSKEEKAALEFNEQRLTWISDDYKLLLNPKNTPGSPRRIDNVVLIDRKADPLESTNIASAKPDLVDEILNKMESWFDSILANNHSFVAPEFVIGINEREVSRINAYGPSKVVGAINNSHRLEDFDEAGEYIEYMLKIDNPGHYQVVANTSQSNLKDLKLRLTCNSRQTEKTLTNGNSQEIGVIDLYEGIHTMRIEILENPEGGTFGRLQTMDFTRLGDPILPAPEVPAEP